MDKLKNMIVFEGLDGAGTTTQMKILGERLEKEGLKVFLTHEPTDNPIGLVVRQCLQHKFTTTPNALGLLYSADRDDHLYNEEYGIVNHLQNNEIVISDRYFYSSIAYQGVQCDLDFIYNINKEFPHPDFLIFVDTPSDDCITRIEKRGEEKELFEKVDFLTKVRKNYLRELNVIPEDVNVLVVDGRLSIEEVSEKIWEWIKPYLLG